MSNNNNNEVLERAKDDEEASLGTAEDDQQKFMKSVMLKDQLDEHEEETSKTMNSDASGNGNGGNGGNGVPKNTSSNLFQRLKSGSIDWKYIFAFFTCLLAHVLFGFQPPFSRYLQKTAKIPSFSLIFTSNLLSLVVYSPRLLYILFRYVRRRKQVVDEEQVGDIISSPDNIVNNNEKKEEQEGNLDSPLRSYEPLWKHRVKYYFKKYGIIVLFVVALITRSSTNILSSRFTKAINVQLLASTTPFIVSVMSLGIVNRFLAADQREQWSWKSLIAMIVTVVGGLMIVLGGAVDKNGPAQGKWYQFLVTYRIDWKTMGSEFTWSDALGMGLTLVSNVALAIYMVVLRFMKSSGLKMSDEVVFVFQEATLVFAFVLPSLIFDDWNIWLKLSGYDWFMFVSFSILIYLVANLTNIISIQALGPSTTGSILALRLVSTILFGGVTLGEWFKSVWQLVGSIIVMAAVTYFIYVQNQTRKIAQKRAEELKQIRDMELQIEEEEIMVEDVEPDNDDNIESYSERRS